MKATVDKVEYEHIPDEHGSAERGEPCIGIRAKATVRVFLPSHPDGHVLIVPITSAGLWSVEAASEPTYFAEVEAEEKAALVELLAAFGLRLDEDRDHVPFGSDPITDSEAMDRITAKLNEPGQWNGGDVCELVATLCTLTNREIKDDDEGDEEAPAEMIEWVAANAGHRWRLDRVQTLSDLQAYAQALYESGDLDESEQMSVSDPDYGWLAPWSVPSSAEVIADNGEDVTILLPSGERVRWSNTDRKWTAA